MICISDSFSGLNDDELNTVVQESISKIEQCERESEQKHFKEIYDNVNNDEVESLMIQQRLRDKLKKLRTGEVK